MPFVLVKPSYLFVAAERSFSGYIFHALGNHECTGATAVNCPLGNETPNIRAFRARLVADHPGLYYDFVVHTMLGDAHFILTAPNAWTAAQDAWLARALAMPATYTITVAHVPPTSNGLAPGTAACVPR